MTGQTALWERNHKLYVCVHKYVNNSVVSLLVVRVFLLVFLLFGIFLQAVQSKEVGSQLLHSAIEATRSRIGPNREGDV